MFVCFGDDVVGDGRREEGLGEEGLEDDEEEVVVVHAVCFRVMCQRRISWGFKRLMGGINSDCWSLSRKGVVSGWRDSGRRFLWLTHWSWRWAGRTILCGCRLTGRLEYQSFNSK